jgi:hypothetical protein
MSRLPRALAPLTSLLASALALALVGAVAPGPGAARADDEPETVAVPPPPAAAKWTLNAAGSPELLVNFDNALSDKQRSMIEGGFTTVSQLTLKLPISPDDEDRDAELPVAYDLRCSVKFDAWEETYDAARLDDQPRTAVLRTYPEYGELCLTAALANPNVVARIGPAGGVVLAYLIVKQTSQEEAGRIKDWLVQQQSGVMQGLFSHMLGELALNQTTKVRVLVPPKPDALVPDPRVKRDTGKKPQTGLKG